VIRSSSATVDRRQTLSAKNGTPASSLPGTSASAAWRRATILPAIWLALIPLAGCSLIGMPVGGSSNQAMISPQDTEEVFRRIREAQTQNAILVQVIGDSNPLRVLPLPPDQRSVFVSDLLKQTGIQEKFGRIRVKVYRAQPGVPAGIPMEVKFNPKTGEVRPDSDYALRAGDRLQVAEDDSVLEGFLDRWLPTSPQ